MFDMRVGTRLALAFGVIVLLLAGMTGYTVVQMDRLDRMQNALERQHQEVVAAIRLKEAFLSQGVAIRSYLLIQDDRFLVDWDNGMAGVRDAIGFLQPAMATSSFAALFDQIQSLAAQFHGRAEQVFALNRSGNRDAAAAMLLDELLPLRQQLAASGDELIDRERQLRDQGAREANAIRSQVRGLTVAIGAVIVLLSILFAYATTLAITRPVRRLAGAADAIGRGDFGPALLLSQPAGYGRANPINSGRTRVRNELVGLAATFASMAELIQRRQKTLSDHAQFADALSASLDVERLANSAAAILAQAIRCEVVAIYLLDEAGELVRAGSHAISRAERTVYRIGEGLPGQAAASRQRIVVGEIPGDTPYVVDDGVGIALPRTLVAVPMLSGSELIGSMVMASLRDLDGDSLAFVDVAARQMGVALSNAKTHARANRLAGELRERNEELQAQAEEIQAQNEELQAQTEEIQAQNEELQAQAEEIQAQNEEIQDQYAQLEASGLRVQKAARLKSAFLSSMSHELRTPLHSILSLTEMLLQRIDGELTPEQDKQLQIVRRNGEMLLGLINDVLDLSKIEAGRVEVRPTGFDLAGMIRQLEQVVRPLAAAKGLRFDVTLDARLGQFCSDEDKVRHILLNLLSNAVKFTETGTVSVHATRVEPTLVSARPSDARVPGEAGTTRSSSDAVVGLLSDSCGVRVEVTDTGMGIPEADLETIFEEFRQIGGGVSRNHGGTGLGLAIARHLARVLGGDIEVRSTVGQGSTFALVVPCLSQVQGERLPRPVDRDTIEAAR